MIVVYRFTVPTILDEQWDGRFGLNMPQDAQILTAHEAIRPPHNIGIYALVNTRNVNELRRFLIVGVGDEITEKTDPTYWIHLATIQSISSYVWNLFELVEG